MHCTSRPPLRTLTVSARIVLKRAARRVPVTARAARRAARSIAALTLVSVLRHGGTPGVEDLHVGLQEWAEMRLLALALALTGLGRMLQ